MFDEPRDIGPQDELSDAERRAFAALPREQAPRAELEERTVGLLRQRGHLPIPLTPYMRSDARRRPSWWVTAAAAAAIAIFFSGMAVGQYLGMSNAAKVATASARTAAEAAQRVQATGDLYVAALASLSRLSDSANVEDRERARQAAMQALGAAAEQMAHIAPEDPLAAAVLRGLNQRNRSVTGPDAPSRSVIWY
jgi:hypothetical protein